MVVMVTGAGGQLGRAIARARAVVALDRAALDVTDARAVAAALDAHQPDVVVNAAAWTGVDAAEAAPEAAWAVNATAPGVVASACAARGVALLHVSTDYVFDGLGGAPYREDAVPHPLSAYGAGKLAGEEAVRAAWPRHGILRTSWVYGPDRPGFVSAILRQARAGCALRVVSDQWGGPTPADGLARAVLAWVDALAERPWGTWHVCGLPHTTWHGFATAIVAAAGAGVPVAPVTTADVPRPARRPPDARLDPSRFTRRFGVAIDWREGLADVVRAW